MGEVVIVSEDYFADLGIEDGDNFRLFLKWAFQLNEFPFERW